MSNFQQISIQDAKQKIDANQVTIVDIRDPGSYHSGHIAGATSITGDEDVEKFLAGTDKQKPVLVYCYHGNSSQGAAAFLSEQGFNEVYSMKGGFEAWRGAYPFEK